MGEHMCKKNLSNQNAGYIIIDGGFHEVLRGRLLQLISSTDYMYSLSLTFIVHHSSPFKAFHYNEVHLLAYL